MEIKTYAIFDDDGICVNVIVADREFCEENFPGHFTILPEGYGIGDIYHEGEWRHAPQPPEPEPQAGIGDMTEALEELGVDMND